MTKYQIILFRGIGMYTAYVGNSYNAACKAVDTARSTLIFAGGTATICARYTDDGTNYPVWDVVDGQATPQIPVREQIVTR